MARVTAQHFIDAKRDKLSMLDIAKKCGVSRQAVNQMKKKYFPDGVVPDPDQDPVQVKVKEEKTESEKHTKMINKFLNDTLQ